MYAYVQQLRGPEHRPTGPGQQAALSLRESSICTPKGVYTSGVRIIFHLLHHYFYTYTPTPQSIIPTPTPIFLNLK